MATEQEDKAATSLLAKGGWIVDRRLASGGGGTVYRCLSSKTLKRVEGILQTSEGNRPTRAKRFLELLDQLHLGEPVFAAAKVAHKKEPRTRREIEALEKVRHRHLVRLLGSDPAQSPSWFVMELIRGGTLGDQLSSFRGRFQEVFQGLHDLVDAVDALQAQGYIHRDIKPPNIFLRETGEWVLGDLGVAFAIDDERLTEDTLNLSRDWIPRWRIKPGEPYPVTFDLYMLTGTALALCLGEKIKSPTWLDEADLELPAQFPDQPGIQEAWSFFRRHFVDSPSDFPSHDAAAFRREVRRVLVALRGNRDARCVCSWAVIGPYGVADANRSLLNQMAVLLPSPTARLIAKFNVREAHRPGPKISLTKFEERFGLIPLGSALTATAHGWTEELTVECSPPLEPGWHKLGFSIEGGGVIDGFVLYAEGPSE